MLPAWPGKNAPIAVINPGHTDGSHFKCIIGGVCRDGIFIASFPTFECNDATSDSACEVDFNLAEYITTRMAVMPWLGLPWPVAWDAGRPPTKCTRSDDDTHHSFQSNDDDDIMLEDPPAPP